MQENGVTNSTITFQEYAAQVLQHKEASGIAKSSTITHYRGMTDRVYPRKSM